MSIVSTFQELSTEQLGIASSIIIGVISGTLTSMVVFLLGRIWKDTILPFIKKTRYHGADVSGQWIAKYNPDATLQDGVRSLSVTLSLEQSTNVLKGSFTHSTTFNDGEARVIDFDVAGSYFEGFLSLTLQSKSNKVFSGGAGYLQITNNGLNMAGSIAHRCSNSNTVESFPIIFTRT